MLAVTSARPAPAAAAKTSSSESAVSEASSTTATTSWPRARSWTAIAPLSISSKSRGTGKRLSEEIALASPCHLGGDLGIVSGADFSVDLRREAGPVAHGPSHHSEGHAGVAHHEGE